MAAKEYTSARPDKWVTLGGRSKAGVKNPTSIEGYYMGREEGPNQFDATKTKVVFLLQTPEGLVGVNGNTNLITKMTDSERGFTSKEGKKPLGAHVTMTYTGEQVTKKGTDMKVFKITFDAANMIELADLPASSDQDEEETAVMSSIEGEDFEDDDYEAPIAKPVPAALSAEARKAKVQSLLSNKRK